MAQVSTPCDSGGRTAESPLLPQGVLTCLSAHVRVLIILMPKVQVGNVGLYYEEHGAGEPLVLIPGFGTGLWIWYRQIPSLAEHFRVIAFDPRGVARSDKPDEAMTMRGYADDAAALLGALGVERAHVLGASFGGFVAQEFALAYPERAR